MPSDFSMKAKEARSKIPVPNVPLAQILVRSAEIRTKTRVRLVVLSCAMSLAMIGTAAAFGTNIFNGVRVWLSGNSGSIAITSFVFVRYPSEADFKSVISTATFPIILPAGLPADVHIQHLIYAPANHPNVVSIEYKSDRTAWHAGFTLVDSTAINGGQPPLPGMPIKVDRWSVGRETVLLPQNILPPAETRRIRNTMLSASPGDLNATSPLLYPATVLGTARDLGKIALRYTPSIGNTVVLGSFFANAIPSLASRGAALIGSNTIYATNIPSLRGRPDYARATLHWPHIIALSSDGVRAVAAALRYSHTEPACNCSLVVNTSDQRHYQVWKISSGTPVRHYRVNAKTLAVSTQ